MELSSGTFRLQLDHILAEGDFVVAAGSRLDDQGWLRRYFPGICQRISLAKTANAPSMSPRENAS